MWSGKNSWAAYFAVVSLAAGVVQIPIAGAAPSQRPSPPQIPPDIVVQMGFGGSPQDVSTPGPGKKGQPPSHPHPALCTFDKNGDLIVNDVCVTADSTNLYVHFTVPAADPLAHYLERDKDAKNILCLRLPHREDTTLSVTLKPEGRTPIVECDMNAPWLYASAQEQRLPYVIAGVNSRQDHVTGTMAIPWSNLPLKPGSTTVFVVTFLRQLPVTRAIAVQVEDAGSTSPAIMMNYAPFATYSTPTPMPGHAAGPIRTHDVGVDLVFQPNEFNQFNASFGQNDAVVAADSSVEKTVSNALFPLPSASPPPAAQTFQTQQFFQYPSASAALNDKYVGSPLGVDPFDLTKIPSLDMGYLYGYANTGANATLLYGLSQPNWYEAFMGQVTIPQPTLRPPSQPTPAPTPPIKGMPTGAAQSALSSNLSLSNEATISQTPIQISFIDSITKTSTSFSSLYGLAFSGAGYRNDCSSTAKHCAASIQFLGSFAEQPNAGYQASTWDALGESATFTTSQADPMSPQSSTFLQIAESFAVQQSSSLFNPVAGDVTAFTPLSGPIGHASVQFGGGNDGLWSADIGAYRLTNGFSDVATQTSWTVGIPFGRVFSIRGGAQAQSISDRIAATEQGVVTGYIGAFAIAPSARTTPEPQPTIFTQNVANLVASYKSPKRGSSPPVELDAGVLYGSGPLCVGATPAPRPTPIGATPGSTFGCLPPTPKHYQFTGAAILGPFPKRNPLAGLELGVAYASAQTFSSAVSGPVGGVANGFGTSAPGTSTGFLMYNGSCFYAEAAYTNAAYVSNMPLAQKGSTVAGEIDVPFKLFGIGFGYFNNIVTNAPSNDQRGGYVSLRLNYPFKAPVLCSAS